MTSKIKKHRGKALKPALQQLSLRLDKDIIDFLYQHIEKNLQVTIRKILRGYVEAHLEDYEMQELDKSFVDKEVGNISHVNVETLPLLNEALLGSQNNSLEITFNENLKVNSDCHEVYSQIKEMMKSSHMGADGYGAQKKAAQLALASFGAEWISKNPLSVDAIVIRLNLREIIKETTPKTHSNYYVVWQRFQKYAVV